MQEERLDLGPRPAAVLQAVEREHYINTNTGSVRRKAGNDTICRHVLTRPRSSRLVIPLAMRPSILEKIHHEGHQGITKCRERAKQSVWWPGLSKQIEDLVESCDRCAKERVNQAEPMIPSDVPERPWQKVGSDNAYCTLARIGHHS